MPDEITAPDPSGPKPADAAPVKGAAKKSTGRGRKAPAGANDTGPRSSGGRPTKAAQTAEKRHDALSGLYKALGLGLIQVGSAQQNPYRQLDGFAVQDQADNLAAVWVALAAENEQVGRIVDMVTTGGAAGAVIFAHYGLVSACQMHRQLDADTARQLAGERVQAMVEAATA